MKVTVERTSTREIQHPRPISPSDLLHRPVFARKPSRRKTKPSGAGVRLKRESSKRSSRPETPLLRWKFDESNAKIDSVEEEEEEKSSDEVARKSGRRVKQVVSARKLGAGLWRLHLPEFKINGPKNLGLPSAGGHRGTQLHVHHMDRMHSSPADNLVHSPHHLSVPKNWLQHKFEPSLQFSNSALEGATKWDPVGGKMPEELKHVFNPTKLLNEQSSDAPVISALETQLQQARTRINELETERRSSKKKLEQFLQKLSEERATWRSREHEKVRVIIDDMKAELSREKKNRQRLEIVNSKLVNELADVKLSAKRYHQEYEKERKTRELIEEVCDELAKEIGEDKAEVETLKRESRKLWEEVEEERKMLQMAEVWREERVQMKLVDAKVMLEDKYSQMNRIIADLEVFLNSRKSTSDIDEMKKAEFLHDVAAAVNIQDIREITYEPPNPDDMFTVFEEMNFGESNERDVEPSIGYSPASQDSKIHTVTPQVKLLNKMNRSGELEEDASEWETVSHPEDQGSSYSPDGSDPSINKSFRASNVSREWERNGGEETPMNEPRQLKKASSISRLWRSSLSNGDHYKIVNGRLSNGGVMSSDCGSGKEGHSPQDLAGQWSSPEISRGTKGCLPRNGQKSSLKARLLEARMENQKIQLRQVLKQKI